MNDDLRWLERHTAHAPPVLRERVMHYAGGDADGELPAHLADAGVRALASVENHPGDRSAALDLLAADALVTLALLAQAQADPSRLHAFAGSMLRSATSAP
ncbi:MAG TPA: hypothetical protein VFY20_13030 [Gemmatimonadales bacterium]|nr:hypothetical protein [Gemmatimonadales bacterium]